MTQQTEAIKNEFKLKIIRQLKDPYSAFNYLLGKREHSMSEHPCKTIARTSDYAVAASEFGLKLKFIWDDSIPYVEEAETLFSRGNGGHNVIFTQEYDPTLVDISENNSMERVTILEEFIEPSESNSDSITLGFRTFYIGHDNHEYNARYDETDFDGSIEFNLSTLTFTDKDGEPVALQDLLDSWEEYVECNFRMSDMVFINHLHNDKKHKELTDRLNLCGVDPLTQFRILGAITEGYFNPKLSGELMYILHALDKLKE